MSLGNLLHHQSLLPEDLKIIAEEESILQGILSSIEQERRRQRNDLAIIKDRYDKLREEAEGAMQSDLPAIIDQINNQVALAQRSKPTPLPNSDSPYFARLRVKENGKVRDICIGHTAFLGRSTPIVDWRNAPVARLFFQYRQGDEYEEEMPGRIAKGEIIARHVVAIEDGVLNQVMTPEATFFKQDSSWRKKDRSAYQLTGGQRSAVRAGGSFGSGAAGLPGPEVMALLDADQYSLLTDSGQAPLLIIGNAGSGKTTVALHRIALLHRQDPQRFQERNIGVIVPEPGLARLSQNLLAALGMAHCRVSTLDHWMQQQAGKVFTRLPAKVCPETPYSVITWKRSRAMMTVVDLYLAAQVEEWHAGLKKLVDFPLPLFESGPLETYVHNLFLPVIKALQNRPASLDSARKLYQQAKGSLDDIAGDRDVILGHRGILEEAARRHGMEQTLVEAVLQHSEKQLAEASAQRYEHIETEHRQTLDGEDIDWGTPEALAQSIDAEDFPWLFYLLFRKVGEFVTRKGALQAFGHLLLDEAQELSPVEFFVLGRAVTAPACVTIAGDAMQSTDPMAHFKDWNQALADFGVPAMTTGRLSTNYRSSQPVASLGHKVLGPLAPPQQPRAVRDGSPVRIDRFSDLGQIIVVLVDELTELMFREPRASVAVIARHEDSALRFHQGLSHIDQARLVLDGDFSFRPGIDITTVANVKGLEFDYVVIPDADRHIYGVDNLSRRAMHVAITRAVHQLWILSGPHPSLLLSDS